MMGCNQLIITNLTIAPVRTVLFLLVTLAVTAAGSVFNPDEVTSLPGLATPPGFRHYAGYLNTTSPNRQLHYWFVESARSPEKDPVLLWLTGGPGCSSIVAQFTELGPFYVHQDGKTLYLNNHSWNLVANVLFLESPAGVGFSYSDDGNVTTDDDQVAADNHAALKHFFLKFPQFKPNDFFITGESYAGYYIPTLSVQVLRHSPDINFKGFTIGNGWLDEVMGGDSRILFAYYHGIFGLTTWMNLINGCCAFSTNFDFGQGAGRPNSSFLFNTNLPCQAAVKEATDVIRSSDINIFNLYADCLSAPPTGDGHRDHLLSRTRKELRLEPLRSNHRNSNKPREYLSKKLIDLEETPPCMDDSRVITYLSQAEVRSALHVAPEAAPWVVCSPKVEATYKKVYNTMRPQFLELVSLGKLKGLVYNGDLDMECNFLGDQWFLDSLGLKLVSDYSKWHYNGQVAGFVKHFQNLSFATVKGAGHMTPTDKPGQVLQLISDFIK